MSKNTEYIEKLNELNEKIVLEPENFELYAERAETYKKIKKFDCAFKDYTKVIELKPDKFLEYYRKRELIYEEIYNREDDALKNYNTLIQVDPHNSKAYLYRGKFYYYKLKNMDEAIKDYNTVIDLNSEYAEAFNTAINPEYGEAYTHRGELYYDINEYGKALSDCDKAIELNPHDYKSYFIKGKVYHKINDNNSALENINNAMELCDNYSNKHAEMLYYRSEIHEKIENYLEAFEDLYDAMDIDPMDDVSGCNCPWNHTSELRRLAHKLLEKEKNQAKIENERKLAEKLAELKTNLFQAVSHTISNIMLANKGIIHKIKNKTSSATDIDRLELLNNLVLSTMKAIKLAFSKDSVAFSKTENDLFFQKTGNSISLYHFLYFCLNINLYYLVTGEEGWETIREIFFAIDENDEDDLEEKLSALETMRKTPGFAISELSENNVNEFVSAFQSKVFQPVSCFFHIQADDLKDIYVKNSSYTFSILFIIFLELSKNMLRYGTVEDESVRKFTIRTETSPEGCRIIMSNICKKSRFSLRESTLQGLAMIQEFSKALGSFEKWENDIPDTDFMEFTTVLFINRQN